MSQLRLHRRGLPLLHSPHRDALLVGRARPLLRLRGAGPVPGRGRGQIRRSQSGQLRPGTGPGGNQPEGQVSKRLTQSFVKSISQPGRYGDGRGGLGLSLLVKRTTNGRWSKTWSQRLRINGKIVTVGLGSFPVITLAHAREKVLENARQAAQGKEIRKRTQQPEP